MKDIVQVDLATIRAHEAKQKRLNVSLGSYHMPPAEEFINWRVVLEKGDLDRLYLLSDFLKHTGGSCKLKDIKSENNKIIQEKMNESTDLRVSPDLAPIIVCTGLESRPLSVIDGNHRISAHYLLHKGIDGAHAYVCVHDQIFKWRHLVPAARR